MVQRERGQYFTTLGRSGKIWAARSSRRSGMGTGRARAFLVKEWPEHLCRGEAGSSSAGTTCTVTLVSLGIENHSPGKEGAAPM